MKQMVLSEDFRGAIGQSAFVDDASHQGDYI
jgi:hypothetical protein